MKDRFKFRYFNKYANKMIEPDNWQNVDEIYENVKQLICLDEGIVHLSYHYIGNDFIFMQCTGLKDKKGKLIYEGDIVKTITQPNTLENIGIVKWDDKSAQFLRTSNMTNESSLVSFWWNDTTEVIGNIYEIQK